VDPGNILENHLRNVVHWLTQQSVTVTGIGIGQDVSQYFPDSCGGFAEPDPIALYMFRRLKPYFDGSA